MSISISIGAVFDASTLPGLAGAVALEVVSIGGDPFLYVAGDGTDGAALVGFSLTGGVTPLATMPVTVGGIGLADLVTIEGPLGPALVTLGRYDTAPGYHALLAGGGFGPVTALGDGSAPYGRAHVGVSYSAGGMSFLAIAPFGQPDLQVLRLTSGPVAVPVQRLTDTPALPLGDVTALATATLHGQDWLFAASGLDSGIVAARIGADGTLSVTDSHLPDEATGFAHVSALDAVQIGPRAFVVFAATGTDSIHVLRLSAGGRLKEVDVFYDTRDTRVANAQALEIFTAADRSFVAVGGGDDGVSIFELTWNGQLVHLATIEDLFTTTLDSLSDLAVVLEAGLIHLFAVSPTDQGVTELVIDPARSGVQIIGGPVPEVLTGTAGDDEIWGKGRSDTLIGLAGDDRLIDGRGRDVMTGGDGADVFVFIPDGRTDVITDFELGVDRIDLSAWDGLYHISALEIGTRQDGAVIFVGEDIIRVRSPEGGPIDAAAFTQDDFIFG